MHVALYNGKEVLQRWRSARQMIDNEDIHTQLMRVYPEVLNLWHILIFVISLPLSFVTCLWWNYIPWWAVLLAMALATFFVLPIGIVLPVTNQQPSLNIVTKYVIGYLLPGDAIANVTLKTYDYIVNFRALTFAADLRLGHYMRIPPRIMFMAQILSTLLCGLVNVLTAGWLIATRPNVCTRAGYPFTCRNSNTFYSASVIWRRYRPSPRVWQQGRRDLLPRPVEVPGRCVPPDFVLARHALVAPYPLAEVCPLAPCCWPPPPTSPPHCRIFFLANGLVVRFVSKYLMKRYRYGWLARYSYLTSAALDTEVAVSELVIFFTVQVWEGGFPYWWGNP